MKSRGEKLVGPPEMARTSAPRTEPPLAVGAKLTWLVNRPWAPRFVFLEFHPYTNEPPPFGGVAPEVTPRARLAVSSELTRSVKSAEAIRGLYHERVVAQYEAGLRTRRKAPKPVSVRTTSGARAGTSESRSTPAPMAET